MKAVLKDNQTGKKAKYLTEVEIYQKEHFLSINFFAHSSKLYSFSNIDNDTLFLADVVEAFISLGIKNHYYELEVAPNGTVFFADVYNDGEKIELTMLPTSLIKKEVISNKDSYQVKVLLDLNQLSGDNRDLKINLFRIDTDGGEQTDKHLFALNPTLSSSFHKPAFFIKID